MCSSGTSSGKGGWVPGVSLKHPKFYPYCQWPNHHLKQCMSAIWNSLFDIHLIFKTHKKNPYSMLIWYSKQPYICNTNPEMNARRISINSLHQKCMFDIHLIFKTALYPIETLKRMSDENQTARWIFIRYSKHTQNPYSIFI